MNNPILPLHSYRATQWPDGIEADDVQAHDDAGTLPTFQLRAPSAYAAKREAARISKHRILRVERIEPAAEEVAA